MAAAVRAITSGSAACDVADIHNGANDLARYVAMCSAIAECHAVDEALDIKDKARALEVYAMQVRNDAEAMLGSMTEAMRADMRRIVPKAMVFIASLNEATGETPADALLDAARALRKVTSAGLSVDALMRSLSPDQRAEIEADLRAGLRILRDAALWCGRGGPQ
jgi:hypothetical protein